MATKSKVSRPSNGARVDGGTKKGALDFGMPAVGLARRLIDLTGVDLVKIIDARGALLLEAEVSGRDANDGYVDRAGAARFLDVSTAQFDKLARDHCLPLHRLGDVKRFDRDEILAWVKARAST